MSLEAQKNGKNFEIIPTVCPVCSAATLAAGAKPLLHVSVSGFTSPRLYEVRICVYGMSKAGFFLERTDVFSGELAARREGDDFLFDLSDVEFRTRFDFFRNLKNAIPGKIYVEAQIDGTKYLGDAQTMLLPRRIYPCGVSPLVFPTFLSPENETVERIAAGARQGGLRALYDALRAERMIYSVKDCDFTAHDVEVSDLYTLLSGRTRLASPLEMAFLFCSCALRAGLFPLFAVLKNKRAPKIFCGTVRQYGALGAVTTSGAALYRAMLDGDAFLFDAADLFTGHNVEFDEAIRSAAEELQRSELIYAVDAAEALHGGVGFLDGGSFRLPDEKEPPRPKTPDDYMLSLAGSDAVRLLTYIPESSADTHGFGFNVRFSGENDPVSAAHTGSITIYPSASSSAGENGVYGISELGAAETAAKCRALLFAAARGDGEIYLACGRIYRNGVEEKCAPAALYPISLRQENGTVRVDFLSPKPFCNRALYEAMRESIGGSDGAPAGDLGSILIEFEHLAASSGGTYRLEKGCRIGVFPFRRSALAQLLSEKRDRIVKDRLSSVLLSGKNVGAADAGKESGSGAEYDREIRKLEQTLPELFPHAAYEAAARSADTDIMVTGASGSMFCDVPLAAAYANIAAGRSTLIAERDGAMRRALRKRFEAAGLSRFVLFLDADTQRGLCGVLQNALKEARAISDGERTAAGSDSDLSDACAARGEALLRYARSKSRVYDFDFSFDEAAQSFVHLGEGLSAAERRTILEPENVFFPDLLADSAKTLFFSAHALCAAALALGGKPHALHPLFCARLTGKEPDPRTFSHLAASCLSELEGLAAGCETVARAMDYPLSDVKSLQALEAFLSLVALAAQEYDAGITDALLEADIYAVSKKLSALRGAAERIGDVRAELQEFDSGIYSLDAATLLEEWNASDRKHSEITKMLAAFRTVELPANKSKKSVPDALRFLYTYTRLTDEFSAESAGMDELFAGYWNGPVTDWEKLSKLADVMKSADVLLKKIYGTDAVHRREAAKCFPKAAAYCAEKVQFAGVLATAARYDKLFSEDGLFAQLSAMISADLYEMSFPDGFFSETGALKMITGWKESAGTLPLVAEYNRRAAACAKLGLAPFVRYLENTPCTPSTERIFMRSLLFLALKQISFGDKAFRAEADYGKTADDYAAALSALCERENAGSCGKLAQCAAAHARAYFDAYPEKVEAFAESLASGKLSPEEILLRYDGAVRALFPVVVAEPAFVSQLSQFDTEVICGADTFGTAEILPVLYAGTHKLIVSGDVDGGYDGAFESEPDDRTFADDCFAAGIPCIRAGRSDADRNTGFFPTVSDECRVRHFKTPVSAYDKNHEVNVLAAQTAGLEVMRRCGEDDAVRIALPAFTRHQCDALRDVLAAVAEKSADTAKALREGRIRVFFAAESRAFDCDAVLVSTVYDKDETSGMALSCGRLERSFSGEANLPREILCALSGDAPEVTVISALSPNEYPAPPASVGMARLARFCTFAAHGGTVLRCRRRNVGIYDAYCTAFCRLMTENGIGIKTAFSGRIPVIAAGDKEYAVLIPDAAEDYADRRLADAGLAPVRIDGADILLDPQKVLERVRELMDDGHEKEAEE